MSDIGTLYVVATPIGNLEDITLRAIRILRETEYIACEDTRVTGFLLKHLEIPRKQLLSYFAGNESRRVAPILALLLAGNNVALVSDAGTPGISDPGERLIAAAIAVGVRVESIPGPCAAIAAVTTSGLNTSQILFAGFLPHKKGRRTMLEQLSKEERTVVLYESPHRVLKALREISAVFGSERRIAVSREITKLHEEICRGAVDSVLADFSKRQSIRGEFVLTIEGAGKGGAQAPQEYDVDVE